MDKKVDLVQIALRWQVEKEVVLGKGQFVCGNKNCEQTEGLRTWEVNFGYIEHGQKKNALVKLRLCPECSYKLNYHHNRREVTRAKRRSSDSEKVVKRQKTDSTETSGSRSADDEAPNVPDGDDKSHRGEPSKSASQDGQKVSEDPNNPWSGPVKIAEEKSREEEFEEYFEDMFM
ncbi:hypothetical protein LSH36_274g06068 [Paralvinella palmiformis]|uniref:Protein FRA10AC1 n=1 Tax=Paralvinella palmiformis TaxID=53620 RepID=A0AAD9JJK0_9ANNE|nr:hypothetical protein LSH36_274g06068 [Paralvinella palmiformis]